MQILARATLSLFWRCWTLRIVVKRKGWLTLATLSSLLACRTLKTVVKWKFCVCGWQPSRHFLRVGCSKLWQNGHFRHRRGTLLSLRVWGTLKTYSFCGGGGVVVFLRWCFCAGVVVVFLWWCFRGGVMVIFLWGCCGGVLVYVLVVRCFQEISLSRLSVCVCVLYVCLFVSVFVYFCLCVCVCMVDCQQGKNKIFLECVCLSITYHWNIRKINSNYLLYFIKKWNHILFQYSYECKFLFCHSKYFEFFKLILFLISK